MAIDNVASEEERELKEFPVETGCNSLLDLNTDGITHDKNEYDKKLWLRFHIETQQQKRIVKVNSAFNLLKSINYVGPTHFVKIDTQGKDVDVVKSMGDYLKETYYIQIETITSHNRNIVMYKGQSIHEDDVIEMDKLGFKVFHIEDYSIGKNETPEANVIFANSELLDL